MKNKSTLHILKNKKRRNTIWWARNIERSIMTMIRRQIIVKIFSGKGRSNHLSRRWLLRRSKTKKIIEDNNTSKDFHHPGNMTGTVNNSIVIIYIIKIIEDNQLDRRNIQTSIDMIRCNKINIDHIFSIQTAGTIIRDNSINRDLSHRNSSFRCIINCSPAINKGNNHEETISIIKITPEIIGTSRAGNTINSNINLDIMTSKLIITIINSSRPRP